MAPPPSCSNTSSGRTCTLMRQPCGEYENRGGAGHSSTAISCGVSNCQMITSGSDALSLSLPLPLSFSLSHVRRTLDISMMTSGSSILSMSLWSSRSSMPKSGPCLDTPSSAHCTQRPCLSTPRSLSFFLFLSLFLSPSLSHLPSPLLKWRQKERRSMNSSAHSTLGQTHHLQEALFLIQTRARPPCQHLP